MRLDKRSLMAIIVSGTVSAGIFWHAQSWHTLGKYAEMTTWIDTGKGILAAVYSIGLMIIFAGSLAILFGTVTDIITRKRD